jgi:hypothetical protein
MQTLLINLSAPHEHESKYYKKGDVIEVTDKQAQWLVDNGVGEIISNKPEQVKEPDLDFQINTNEELS